MVEDYHRDDHDDDDDDAQTSQVGVVDDEHISEIVQAVW